MMKRLSILLLLALWSPAAARAQASAGPRSIAGFRYSVPSGYAAAPALGDSATAVFTRAPTAVALAALPRGTETPDAIQRLRGVLARAVSERAGAIHWRMITSAPASPFDVYHERWIGYDGAQAVIADFNHLRKDGRDVLLATAFSTREGRPEQMFRTGTTSRTHAFTTRASARWIAELVGDPPYEESGDGLGGSGGPTSTEVAVDADDFSGSGGATPPRPPVHPDEAAIRAAFDGYRTALLARDGEGALAHVSPAVLEYYGYAQRLALYGTADEVRARPLSDQMFVLLMRERVPLARLREMTGREVFAHGVAQGWISDESTRTQQVGRIGVAGNMAFAEVLADGRPTPLRVQFVRRDGAWKWDLLGIVQWMDPVFRQLAEANGITPEVLLTRVVEAVTRRRLSPTVWDPPLRR